MKVAIASLAAGLAVIITSAPVFAKGATVRITIKGGDLPAPIEITERNVAEFFHVWSGAGTSSNEAQGLIVDWSRGVAAEPPKDLPFYDVSFQTTRRERGTYVVRYVVDPSTSRGYVYIPGPADKEYPDNVWLIYRGVEGKWFHAWSDWETLARPLIANAEKIP